MNPSTTPGTFATKALKAFLSVVLALLVGVGVIGLALLPAASRVAITWGVDHYSKPSIDVEWFSEEEVSQAAQAVWGFVVKGDPSTLPNEIDGQEAFPSDQVQHLRDVQSLLNATWIALIVSIIMAAALVPLYVRLFGNRAFGRTLAVTGASILVCILVVGGAALLDFDRFFDLFHGLLFSAGTWTFSASSLLINCFPEPFWEFLGSIWLGGVVILSLALLGFGVAFHRRGSQDK